MKTRDITGQSFQFTVRKALDYGTHHGAFIILAHTSTEILELL
jgi:hypothetical protein